MLLRDRLLALTIVMVWGINFVVIKVGLQGMPPLLLAALRFALVAFPGILFIRRPQVPLKWLLAYGLTISFGQFALLFWALKAGLAAGLASLILQVQAFFTLGLGVILLKEKIRAHNILAVVTAAAGLLLLATAHGQDSTTLNVFTLLLIAGAAFSWACGNIVNKIIMRHYPVPAMSLVIWSALVPALAFSLSSLLIEGPDTVLLSLSGIGWHSVFSVIYLSLLATIVGYGGWSYLLSRYETPVVAPLSLLVPVFGLLSAMVLLGEHLSLPQLAGVVVIAAGLVINVTGSRWFRPRREAEKPQA